MELARIATAKLLLSQRTAALSVFVRRGIAARPAGGRLSAAAGCPRAMCQRGLSTTRPSRPLPQPWQSHSQAGAAARAEAVVAHPRPCTPGCGRLRARRSANVVTAGAMPVDMYG